MGIPVVTYATYEEVFGAPINEFDLRQRIKYLSVEDCLQTVGKLSTLLASHEQLKADAVVAETLGPVPRARAEALVAQGRPIVFGKRLSAVARIAIEHAVERPPDSFSDGSRVAWFMETILGVADVFDRHRELREMSEAEVREWFASFQLRRLGAPTRSLRNTMLRIVRVFIDLPERRPELLTGGSPSAAFVERAEIGLERYIAICFAIHARFGNWEGEPDSWLLGADYWEKTSVTKDEFLRVARTASATVARLREAFAAEREAGFDSLDDLRPFLIHPLCEVVDEVFLTVDVELLGDALFGDGLYWRLRPGVDAEQQARSEFGETVGHLLEAHCWEVAESVYANAEGAKAFPEIGYDGEDGPDLAVFEEGAATFVEVGTNRPHVRDTLGRGSLQSFDLDVEKLILPRAHQLDRKITDFSQGRLVYAGHAPDDRRVFPVICLMDGFPLGHLLYDRIVTAVHGAGFLQQADLEPLAVISVEDYEHLMGFVESGHRLSEILRTHAASQFREASIREFMLAEFGAPLKIPKLLDQEFEAAAGRLVRQLFGEENQVPTAGS